MVKHIVELTKKEAVENLKFLLECNYVDSFEETEKEAIKMGIEALNHYGGNSINNHVFNQSNCSNIRDILCNTVTKVFGSSDTFFTFILNEKYSSNYDCYVDGSGENYIINNVTGEYINWYKLHHLGRCASASISRFNYKNIEQWFEIFLTEFKEGGHHENN